MNVKLSLSSWVFGVLASVPAAAQCGYFYTPGTGCVGFDGLVNELLRWDPDGAGPQPEVLVCGGTFSLAGTTSCGGVATFDAQTGSIAALGPPVFRTVDAMLVTASGTLVMAGELALGGGHMVASWDGTLWGPFGSFDRPVRSLIERGTGEIVAGGEFLQVDGAFVGGVASWNGSQWSALGGGVSAPSHGAVVHDCAELPGGDLVIAGAFDAAGGVAAANVARWNGTSWAALGSGLDGGRVAALAVRGGALFAGGQLLDPAFFGMATWNGTTWTAVAGVPQTAQEVTALSTTGAGDLLFATADRVTVLNWNPAGDMRAFRLGSAGGMAQQIGAEFTQATGADRVYAMIELPGGNVATGGSMLRTPGLDVGCFAVFDNGAWQTFGDGLGLPAECVTVRRDGTPVVGGPFVGGVAELVNGTWQLVGGGVSGVEFFPRVRELLEAPNGDLYVAGSFGAVGGMSAGSVARWDGVSWDTLGGGVQVGWIESMQQMPNGDILLAGFLGQGGFSGPLLRWDGSAWSWNFSPRAKASPTRETCR
ncbi:MAG: hypothetical protein AB8H80_23675 [Planctomycetota bacterium]